MGNRILKYSCAAPTHFLDGFINEVVKFPNERYTLSVNEEELQQKTPRKFSRRKMLKGIGGVGAAFGLGIAGRFGWDAAGQLKDQFSSERRNNGSERTITREELLTLADTLAKFVKPDADPTLWQRLKKASAPLAKPDDLKYFTAEYATTDGQRENSVSYSYNSGNNSEWRLLLTITEPDGSEYFHSTSVDVKLLGNAFLSRDRLKENASSYFIEPAGMQNAVWEEIKLLNGSVPVTGLGRKFQSPDGFAFFETIYDKGQASPYSHGSDIQFSMVYPTADTSDHIIKPPVFLNP